MNVIRTEEPSKHYRVVSYFVPRCRLRFIYYYAGSNQEIRVFYCYKRSKDLGAVRPFIRFDKTAAMVMFEAYLAALLKQYRSPRHSYRIGSHSHATLIWWDIMDRYIGGDRHTAMLYMGWHSVNELVKEMRHHGKFPDADNR